MRGRSILVLLLLTPLIGVGCAETRGNNLQEEASKLARKGRFEEAISTLERARELYKDSPAARDVEKQIVIYRGLLEADHKEKRRRANEDLIELGRSLLQYQLAKGRYPASLDELASGASVQGIDPWGRGYRYQAEAAGKHYKLGCLGADGKPGGGGDDQDLLVENGEFSKALSWEDK